MSTDTVVVERAGRSPEELAFLISMVERPTDDGGRLAYADWLEERGDARGEFLRRFVRAYLSNQPLPDLAGVDPAWADLTGLTITSKMVECGLRDWRDELLALARPALRLEAGEADFDNPPPPPAALGMTRLGGDPDLPANTAYPTAADGVPLHFLGQFNLADLRGTVAGRYFPPAGLLSLFRPQAQGICCLPTRQDCPRLVRLTAPGTPLVRLPRPTGLADPPAPFPRGCAWWKPSACPASSASGRG